MFEKMRLQSRCVLCRGSMKILILLIVLPFYAQASDLDGSNGAQEQPGTRGDGACCTIPSLSAVHVNRHEPSDQEIMRARIELSPYGLRVTELGQHASLEMLQNFVTEQAWLVDRKRRIFHKLPLTSDPMGFTLNPHSGASFLGHKPCGNLKASAAEPGLWRGRTVDAVRCIDAAGQEQAAELLDHYYKIVVYRRDKQGFVDELQDLQNREFDSGFFFPSSEYRSVGKKEFFSGAPALRSYDPSR